MSLGQDLVDRRADERPGDPVVLMRKISKRYPGVLALDQVDLVLFPGEIHALTGENGSGKSTLARILYGDQRPDAGVVEVDGAPVVLRSPAAARKLGIVGISQELTLAPTLSVAENVLMGRLPRRKSGVIDWAAARREAGDVLERLGVAVRPSARVDDLGVELQQEVEIARAVSCQSRVLVLDEATSSLSERATTRLLEMLRQLRDDGVSVLLISHRLSELYACASRATVLRDGRRTATVSLHETSQDDLVRLMVGRELRDLYGRRRRRVGEEVIAVRGLRARALRPVSFTVRRGEIIGIAGLVGSGKAEIGLGLAGAIPTEGEVVVRGRRVRLSNPRRAIAAGIGYVTDDRKRSGILPHRSLEQNLSIAWGAKFQRFGFASVRAERALAKETIRRLGIVPPDPRVRITALSGGNQQKAVVGRWLMIGREVLVLSEPTRGIDVGGKSDLYRLIQDIAEAGAAVIMISSELPELLGVSDRILVMFEGTLRGEFRAEETDEEALAQVAVAGGKSQ